MLPKAHLTSHSRMSGYQYNKYLFLDYLSAEWCFADESFDPKTKSLLAEHYTKKTANQTNNRGISFYKKWK